MRNPRLNTNILEVPLYIAGRSIQEIEEDYGLTKVTKLASNESPVGPSPLALEAAQRMLQEAHRYPGVVERDLRRKLAARLHPELDESNIVIGNGGTDVLRMITQAFVFDGGNTVMSRAAFPMYHIFTTTFGGTPRQVAPAPDYGHDLAAMANQIDDDTRIVYLCSPNNPTGHIITQAEADEFMDCVPGHVVVVFDEAYRAYVTAPEYADSLAYVKEGRNVLILRSFSKAMGLANMRVGYLIGPVELANYLQHVRLPFHTGDIPLAAALASLDDTVYHTRHRKTVLEEREYLYTALCEMNPSLNCLPSQANFIIILDPPMGAGALTERLLQRGFIVRAMGAFGLPNAIRVSIGTPEENRKFVAVLEDVLEKSTVDKVDR
ncbi:MAG: histidinol-phosphate transaminase [Anaerolineales bacterium]